MRKLNQNACRLSANTPFDGYDYLRRSQIEIRMKGKGPKNARLKPGIRVCLDCEIEHDRLPGTLFVTFQKELTDKEALTATAEEIARGKIRQFARFELADGIEFHELPPTYFTNGALQAIALESNGRKSKAQDILARILSVVAARRGVIHLRCAMWRESPLEQEFVVNGIDSELTFSVGKYHSSIDIPEDGKELVELFSQVLDFDPPVQPKPAKRS